MLCFLICCLLLLLLLSRFSRVQLCATPQTTAHQAPMSLGFCGQEHWSGLPFPSRCMWELDYKECWAPKNWFFWTVVLEKTLESPLDCKEIQPVHPKGDQSWMFIRRTDAEAVTPVLCPPHAESWLIGKDPDAGKDWGQEEKGRTEDETVAWHHWLDGHGFGWTLGVGDGQGGLACCGSWGSKESDMTEWLNWTDGPGCHYLHFLNVEF